MFLLVHTAGDPMAALPAVRAALRSIDPHQPIYAIDTLAARFQSTVMMRRMVSAVLLVLAGVALLLAAMGIYGIVAFMASQREREFGIRLALGASARQLVIELLRRTSSLVAIGIGFGLLGAIALARVMGTMGGFIFGVSPQDPTTLIATAMLLLAVTLVASLVPARRAAKADPMTAFK